MPSRWSRRSSKHSAQRLRTMTWRSLRVVLAAFDTPLSGRPARWVLRARRRSDCGASTRRRVLRIASTWRCRNDRGGSRIRPPRSRSLMPPLDRSARHSVGVRRARHRHPRNLRPEGTRARYGRGRLEDPKSSPNCLECLGQYLGTLMASEGGLKAHDRRPLRHQTLPQQLAGSTHALAIRQQDNRRRRWQCLQVVIDTHRTPCDLFSTCPDSFASGTPCAMAALAVLGIGRSSTSPPSGRPCACAALARCAATGPPREYPCTMMSAGAMPRSFTRC